MGQEGFKRLFSVHSKGSSGGVLMPATTELCGNIPHAVVAGGAEAGLGEDFVVLFFFAQEQGHTDSCQSAELFHEAFCIFTAASRLGKGGTGYKGGRESAAFKQARLRHEAAPEAELGLAPVIFQLFTQGGDIKPLFAEQGREAQGTRSGIAVAEIAGVARQGNVKRFCQWALHSHAEFENDEAHELPGC